MREDAADSMSSSASKSYISSSSAPSCTSTISIAAETRLNVAEKGAGGPITDDDEWPLDDGRLPITLDVDESADEWFGAREVADTEEVEEVYVSS